MMDGWNEVKLEEIAEVVGGGTPSSKEDSYWNGDVNWVTPADLSGYMFKHISYGERKITKLGLSKSSAKLHPKGTVLMTSRAPIGYLAIAGDEVATNQGFQSLRCKTDKVDNNFLYYILHLYKEGIQAIASGATFPEVSGKKVKGFKIKIPPLLTQRKIASILSAYDDLIENNLKRIKLLEEKAQLTYEEWFVRMKFPGHETTPINQETGLPEGWERKNLVDCCDLTMGQSPKSEFYNDQGNGLPFHQGVKDYGFRFPENSSWSTAGNRIAQTNSILFSVRAPVGRLNVAIEKIILGRGLAAINHKKGWNNFLLYQLQKIFFEDNLMGGGAIFSSVTKKDVERIKLIHATNELTGHFNEIAFHVDEAIKVLTKQNKNLKEARDILLPRLMTGMIDVDQIKLEDLQPTNA